MRCSKSEYESVLADIEAQGYSHVVGTISNLDEEVIEMAIETYNEGETDAEYIIDRDTFDGYFGDVAINDPRTVYIKKANTLLTPNHIVSAGNRLTIVSYDEIMWAYRFDQSYNLIPILTNIRIYTNKFVLKNISDMSGLTFKKTEIINQILETIQAHNPQVAIGYTAELNNYFKSLKNKQKHKVKHHNSDIRREEKGCKMTALFIINSNFPLNLYLEQLILTKARLIIKRNVVFINICFTSKTHPLLRNFFHSCIWFL